MGIWSYLFGKAVYDTVKEVKKEVAQEKAQKQKEQQRLAVGLSEADRIYNFVSGLNTDFAPYVYRNKITIETEIAFDLSRVVCGNGFEIDKRLRLLNQIKSNPNDVSLRIQFIENQMQLLSFASFTGNDHSEDLFLIEECRHHIEYAMPKLNTLDSSVPIRYLLLAADSNLYIMQGNFTRAMKLCYKILTWRQMLNNIYKESFNYDSTEELYGYTVANIMSIFKAMGNKSRVSEVGRMFSAVLSYHKKFNNNAIHDAYTQARADSFMLSKEFSGFYLMAPDPRNSGTTILKSRLLPGETHYYTDYFSFNQNHLTNGGFCALIGSAPISASLLAHHRTKIEDFWCGRNSDTDKDAYSEEYCGIKNEVVSRAQNHSALLAIGKDIYENIVTPLSKENPEVKLYMSNLGVLFLPLFGAKFVYLNQGYFTTEQYDYLQGALESVYKDFDIGFTSEEFLSGNINAFDIVDDATCVSNTNVGKCWISIYELISKKSPKEQKDLLNQIADILVGGILSFANKGGNGNNLSKPLSELRNTLSISFETVVPLIEQQKEDNDSPIASNDKSADLQNIYTMTEALFEGNTNNLDAKSILDDFCMSISMVLSLSSKCPVDEQMDILKMCFNSLSVKVNIEAFIEAISNDDSMMEHLSTSYLFAIRLILMVSVEKDMRQEGMDIVTAMVDLLTEIENKIIAKYPSCGLKSFSINKITELLNVCNEE